MNIIKYLAAKYLPKNIVHDIRYTRCHKRKMSWDNPQTIDEKLHWSMVYNIGKNESRYVDKIEVRQYIKECGYDDMLIPLVLEGVYKKMKDIPFEKLPEKFVLLANHGSGPDYIVKCNNKKEIEWDKVIKKMNKALSFDFSLDCNEYQYKYIKRRIMVEEYLDDHNKDLIDYKFLCFDGEPFIVQVISDRSDGMKINYYDLDWKFIDCGKDYPYAEEIKRPISFDRMIEACKKIGKGMLLCQDLAQIKMRGSAS